MARVERLDRFAVELVPAVNSDVTFTAYEAIGENDIFFNAGNEQSKWNGLARCDSIIWLL